MEKIKIIFHFPFRFKKELLQEKPKEKLSKKLLKKVKLPAKKIKQKVFKMDLLDKLKEYYQLKKNRFSFNKNKED